jgi:hypothetical protein
MFRIGWRRTSEGFGEGNSGHWRCRADLSGIYTKKTRRTEFLEEIEEHKLGGRIFERVQEHLQERGLGIGRGTIVDATNVHAPSSLNPLIRQNIVHSRNQRFGDKLDSGSPVRFAQTEAKARTPAFEAALSDAIATAERILDRLDRKWPVKSPARAG